MSNEVIEIFRMEIYRQKILSKKFKSHEQQQKYSQIEAAQNNVSVGFNNSEDPKRKTQLTVPNDDTKCSCVNEQEIQNIEPCKLVKDFNCTHNKILKTVTCNPEANLLETEKLEETKDRHIEIAALSTSVSNVSIESIPIEESNEETNVTMDEVREKDIEQMRVTVISELKRISAETITDLIQKSIRISLSELVLLIQIKSQLDANVDLYHTI